MLLRLANDQQHICTVLGVNEVRMLRISWQADTIRALFCDCDKKHAVMNQHLVVGEC